MALIKCPECKRKISDQCETCPQCGYPVKQKLQEESLDQNTDDTGAPKKKPFYKKVWVWVVIGIVLVALVLGTVFLLRYNAKPKLDGDGKPVFVELTNEVYTNAKRYKGYHINIKGQVFQAMSDDGNTKGIQVWLDPDTCEQNMMIYYNTDTEVKQGDYISCTGYIDSVTKYKNAYGANMYAPKIISSDLKQVTYIEAMAPTTATITPDNLRYKKYGYEVSVDKIEFSERETRVYVTVTNNGNANFYFGNAVVIQDGKQYEETRNSGADYAEISNEIVTGASSSGVVAFPALSANGFELSIDIHSDDYDERFEKFVFSVKEETNNVVDVNYRSAVETILDFYNGELEDITKILPQTLWEGISRDMDWSIAEVQANLKTWYTEVVDFRAQFCTIESEERLAQNQLYDCWVGINRRYGCFGVEIDSISDGYSLSIEITRMNGEKVIENPTIILIGDNWYWIQSYGTEYPAFATGPFTPAT